jgi:hypothetical protein
MKLFTISVSSIPDLLIPLPSAVFITCGQLSITTAFINDRSSILNHNASQMGQRICLIHIHLVKQRDPITCPHFGRVTRTATSHLETSEQRSSVGSGAAWAASSRFDISALLDALVLLEALVLLCTAEIGSSVVCRTCSLHRRNMFDVWSLGGR